MVNSVFDNGGYRSIKVSRGVIPALVLRGTAVALNSTITLPAHGVGDLIVIFCGGLNAPAVPQGWTTAASSNGGAIGYKTAASSNEVSGTWSGGPAIFAAVVAGGAIGAASVSAQANFYSTPTQVFCPAITATDLSGSAIRFRYLASRTQSAQAATWNSAIPAGYTLRHEINNSYAASRMFSDNNTRRPATSVSAGILAPPVTTEYWVGATVEITGV